MTRAAFFVVSAALFCPFACGGGPGGGGEKAAPAEKAVPTDSKTAAPTKEAGKAEAPPTASKGREPVNPREVKVSGITRDEVIAGLRFSVPAEWTRKPGTTPMRMAEFTVPGPGGEAEMVVYRFAGGGGDARSNVFRWRTQFTHADGSPLGEDEGKVKETERTPLKLTQVDLAGTYVAAVTPGSSEKYSDPDYRMLALIVEGSGDPYFFKAVGPAATLKIWEASFAAFADTVAPGP